MNRLLLILILTFSVQSLVKADDISDFEIEGMSVGDSLLEFATKENIQLGKVKYYENDKYNVTELYPYEFKINISTFDLMQMQFLTNDKKMRIESISGINYYKNNIKDCYEKLDDIYEEVFLVLSSWKELGKEAYEVSSAKITDYMLESNSQDEVQIGCYDYYDDTKNVDHFRIAIRTSAYRAWLREQVYN